MPQDREQHVPAPDYHDEDKTPSIQKYIPVLQEGARKLFQQHEQLKGEPEAQKVEPPPTSEAPGKAKPTSTGDKQPNNKRPAWKSAAADHLSRGGRPIPGPPQRLSRDLPECIQL